MRLNSSCCGRIDSRRRRRQVSERKRAKEREKMKTGNNREERGPKLLRGDGSLLPSPHSLRQTDMDGRVARSYF
jgi:hypothetical protein